jgi:serine/threonine protein kinase
MKFQLEEHIGKYPIEREIGSGATSRVYLARDPFADRDVAIKVFLFDKQIDPHTERMMHKAFLTEASLAGKLNHPHIIDIYDAVAEPDRSYLVMEYVPGTTLESHSDVATLLPLNKVVEIVFKCIRALEYAHQHGIIHRDIKPGNILLSKSGETKVGDFGASFQHRHETTQITGIGSPAYMSPEQVRAEDLDQRTDIYSLGIVMYRLLTGRLPYEAPTQAALTYAILNTPPPRLATLRPDLPPFLDRIVMRAIEKDAAARYPNWLEFGKDLSQAFMSLRLAGESIGDSEKFNKLRDMAFFQDFGDVALWETVRIASWRTVASSKVMIREGEQGESFYILLDGEVTVTLTGKELNTLRAGACFGEVIYFAGRTGRRTTTITTSKPVTVLEIKAEALRAATDGCQVAFNKAFMRVLIDRLTQANQKLAER